MPDSPTFLILCHLIRSSLLSQKSLHLRHQHVFEITPVVSISDTTMNSNGEQQLHPVFSPNPPTTGAPSRALAETSAQLEQETADGHNVVQHGLLDRPAQDVQIGPHQSTILWAPFQQLDDLAFFDTVTSEPEVDLEDTDEDDTDEEELDWPADLFDVDFDRILRNLAENEALDNRRGNAIRSAMTETAEKRKSSPECKICLDEVDDGLHADCGHTCCKGCLKEYIKHSLQDRSSFPPVCCTRVLNAKNLREHLDEDVLTLVDARWDEWSDRRPTYCFDCSKYLKDNADGDYKHCSCGCSTCTICKVGQSYHLVQGVHPEKVDHQVQQVASTKGWKECPGCLTLVARRYGCDHMQCSCKTFFCYRCGSELPDQRPCRCRTRDIDLDGHAGGRAVVRRLPVHQGTTIIQRWSFPLGQGPQLLVHRQPDTTRAHQLAGLDFTDDDGGDNGGDNEGDNEGDNRGRNEFIRYLVWWSVWISVASVLSPSVLVWVGVLSVVSVGALVLMSKQN